MSLLSSVPLYVVLTACSACLLSDLATKLADSVLSCLRLRASQIDVSIRNGKARYDKAWTTSVILSSIIFAPFDMDSEWLV